MLNRLLGRREEERAISFQTLFASGDSLYMTTNAGTPMDQRLSLEITTVYACVRLISDSISTMPMDTYIRVDGDRRAYRPRPVWLDYPDIGVTRIEHFQQVLVSLMLDGNAFVRINRRSDGEVLGLTVLNPQKTQVHRDGSGQIYYTYETVARIDASDMLHITELRLPGELRGKSRIDLLKENLGLASALQEFASRFFGNGSSTSGIIEWPGNLTREQAKNLVEAFEEGHKGLRRSHRPGVLFGGATYKQTTVPPNDSQFLESRRFAVEEIARIFRCPPSMLGVTEPGASSYASVEANGIHFVMHTLRPYVQKLEEAYSRLLPGVAFFRINIDGLMRGDYASRVAGYGSGLQSGWLSINDVRRFEDLRPVDGGDTYRVPLANVDLTAANLGEIERKTAIAQRLIASGFDPQAVLKFLELPTIEHTGVPTVALQPVASINPINPADVYDVAQRDVNVTMPEILVNVPQPVVNVPAPVVNVPETVVRVNVPETKPIVRTVERDEQGRILHIVERVEG